uniref:Uncharacterized protein n=1 Tax=Arundo donax TaxID=35708 RepID=A0A0A8YZ11_ARUDO
MHELTTAASGKLTKTQVTYAKSDTDEQQWDLPQVVDGKVVRCRA